jgi:hypothetical protein
MDRSARDLVSTIPKVAISPELRVQRPGSGPRDYAKSIIVNNLGSRTKSLDDAGYPSRGRPLGHSKPLGRARVLKISVKN